MTLLVERLEGHPAYKEAGFWSVSGDELTGALHDVQESPPLPSFLAPIKSRVATFWYTGLPRVSWNTVVKRVSSSSSVITASV